MNDVTESAKPWLETWRFDPTDNSVRSDGPVKLVACPFHASGHERAMADLIAAAPALVRALLEVEWEGHESYPCCPSCKCGSRLTDEGREALCHGECELDAALTAAGLPTQAERDAARERMR